MHSRAAKKLVATNELVAGSKIDTFPTEAARPIAPLAELGQFILNRDWVKQFSYSLARKAAIEGGKGKR